MLYSDLIKLPPKKSLRKGRVVPVLRHGSGFLSGGGVDLDNFVFLVDSWDRPLTSEESLSRYRVGKPLFGVKYK